MCHGHGGATRRHTGDNRLHTLGQVRDVEMTMSVPIDTTNISGNLESKQKEEIGEGKGRLLKYR